MKTAEHWMMAEKARLFEDSAAVDAILAAPDPKSAKALGRKVQNFNGQLWAARCREIVTRGNVEKFRQHEPLRNFLWPALVASSWKRAPTIGSGALA